MRGKREMRKNYTPFLAGMVTMVLLIGLISASFAANSASGGTPAPSQAGVALFGQEQIAAGETLTTGQGAKVPKVLTYTDAKGEDHYFIEVTAAAELFDVSYGVAFNEEENRVEFGAVPPASNPEPVTVHWADPDFDPPEDFEDTYTPTPVWFFDEPRHDFVTGSVVSAEGAAVTVGESTPVSTGDFTISVSSHESDVFDITDPAVQAARQEAWAQKKAYLKTVPEYGTAGGMFTEVNPEEMNLGSFSGRSMDREEFQDSDFIEHTFAFTPKLGKYAAITIENTAKADVQIVLSRPYTIGASAEASFSSIYIPAGGKIVRAFRIDETKALENCLTLRGYALGEGGVNLKLTAEQYRSGT